MATTTFQGPVRSGTIKENAGANLGLAVLSQTGTITQNSTTAVDLTFYLPAGSQILGWKLDVTTAFNSATSAILSIGRTSGGTELADSIDVSAAGRIDLDASLSATQIANMADISSNVAVVATFTPTGATSAGVLRLSVIYVQKP